jgi:hypothetical protein
MVEAKKSPGNVASMIGISALSVTLFVGLMSLYDTRIIPLVMNEASKQFASKDVVERVMNSLSNLATKESISGLQHRLDQIESRLMHLERKDSNK